MKLSQTMILPFCLALQFFPALPASAVTNDQNWTGTSSFEGPRHSGSATASGALVVTEEGRSWEVQRQGVVDGNKEWESVTTGSGSKTDTGYEKSSVTEGTSEHGMDWTTTRDVEAVKNDDGTMTINRNANVVLENGKTVTKESQTVVTKTEDGRTWETTGTQTGPKGTATMSGSGTAVKGADGVNVNIDREGTSADGAKWQSTTTGTGVKTDTGRKWDSTTVGATEGSQTWQATRQGELNKSGAAPGVQRKTAVEKKTAASGTKTAKPAKATKQIKSAKPAGTTGKTVTAPSGSCKKSGKKTVGRVIKK